MASFTIPGKLPNLNDYTGACRSHPQAGAKMKATAEEIVRWCIKGATPYTEPVHITFRWVEPNRRRDKDNVAFAKKFILDALVAEGVLGGDGWKHVTGFSDEFDIDRENPRIEVDIKPTVWRGK